ncbi:MAG: 30S ribosomal protein S17 [Pseudomonadota bacterium]
MKKRGNQKTKTGTVVSNKMEKTVVVSVERLVKHQAYQKFTRMKAKFMAHDERNECQIGDRVLLTETRPLSKQKRFKVSQIIAKME